MSIYTKNPSLFSKAPVIIAASCLPFSSAFAALWTPTNISTVAWYDASIAANVVTSGSNVTSWIDSSGNGYDLNTVPGGNYPVYGSTQINGLNAINLDSTFDELYRAGIPSINLTQLTVISVGMPQAAGDFPNLGSVYSTDLTDKLYLRLQNTDVSGKISSGLTVDGTAATLSTSNNVAIRDGVPVMLAAYYDGFDAVSRVNGGALSATNTAAPDGATFTINEIQIGRDSGTPRNYHGEMIILATADLATIEKVEGYLAWKWGMEDALPVDHTYKLAAPVIPEPSSLALFGLSSLGLLLRRRRQ